METSITQEGGLTAAVGGVDVDANANVNEHEGAIQPGSQGDNNNGGNGAPAEGDAENEGAMSRAASLLESLKTSCGQIFAHLFHMFLVFIGRAETDGAGVDAAPLPNAEAQEENDPNDGNHDEQEEQVINYDSLNLPNLNKELSRVQVCRRCNYCYCSTCGFQHQCNCCGCSYWM
jgi:hypothetical protein